MEIETLRLFVKVAEMLNISGAGRALGFAPAMASARLSKLENQIGTDLIHRSTRKVALSTEGERFLPYAREILAQHDAALAAIGSELDQVSGVLRFAASSTFAQLYIMPILPEFLARYPDLDIELKLGDQEINIIEGSIDLALRNTAVSDSNLRARQLAPDRRILCASPDYLSRHGFISHPDELANHQLIAFKANRKRMLSGDELPDMMAFPPQTTKARLVCDDGTSMRIATLAGAGVSMHAFWSVAQDIKAGRLVRVLPDYEIDDQTAIWLVYPKANAVSMKVRVFIDYLVEKIGSPPIWEREGDHL